MIKRIKPEHYNELIHLWIDCELDYRPAGRDSKEEIAKHMTSDPDAFWGYFKDNRIIGSIIVTDDGRKGWINRLAVHPEFRGCSLARKLINKAETLLQSRGINIVAVLIYDSNLPSLNLFKSENYDQFENITYLRRTFVDGV